MRHQNMQNSSTKWNKSQNQKESFISSLSLKGCWCLEHFHFHFHLLVSLSFERLLAILATSTNVSLAVLCWQSPCAAAAPSAASAAPSAPNALVGLGPLPPRAAAPQEAGQVLQVPPGRPSSARRNPLGSLFAPGPEKLWQRERHPAISQECSKEWRSSF